MIKPSTILQTNPFYTCPSDRAEVDLPGYCFQRDLTCTGKEFASAHKRMMPALHGISSADPGTHTLVLEYYPRLREDLPHVADRSVSARFISGITVCQSCSVSDASGYNINV